jgi:hypothetical protein
MKSIMTATPSSGRTFINKTFEDWAVGPEQMIRIRKQIKKVGVTVVAALGLVLWLSFNIWMFAEVPKQLRVIRTAVQTITSRN